MLPQKVGKEYRDIFLKKKIMCDKGLILGVKQMIEGLFSNTEFIKKSNK